MLRRVKCVLVGDSKVGKTSLCESYVYNHFTETYVPTIFQNYSSNCLWNDLRVTLDFWDTSGSDAHKEFRLETAYSDASLFILCFSITNLDSYDNILNKWYPEIRTFSPQAPVILVACKCDMRELNETYEDFKENNKDYVSKEQGLSLKSLINAEKYIECSAKMNIHDKNLNNLIQEILKVGVYPMLKPQHRKSECKTS